MRGRPTGPQQVEDLTDEERFGAIYERCYPAIHAYCRRRTASDRVDDAVAETFLELCTMPLADWVTEYDAQCTSLSPTDSLDDLVAHIRLLPSADASAVATLRLKQADRTLIVDGVQADQIAELQQQRLEAMIELGIDERCHPTVA